MGKEIILMNRETLLEKLRISYKEKDIGTLKRALTLWHYFLLEEDKVKIQQAIYKLEESGITEHSKFLIDKAKKELT